MGISSSDNFLSENDINSMEFNFLVKPTFQIEQERHNTTSGSEDDDRRQYHPEDQKRKVLEEEEDPIREERFEKLKPSFQIKLPCPGEFKVQIEEEDDGFKTPTSTDQKIPDTLQCPPAPRKPKSIPLEKRKANREQIIVDLSTEMIKSFIVPVYVQDFGGKLKKARPGNY